MPKIVHWADELRFLLRTGGGERKPSQRPGLHVPVQEGRCALRHSLSRCQWSLADADASQLVSHLPASPEGQMLQLRPSLFAAICSRFI